MGHALKAAMKQTLLGPTDGEARAIRFGLYRGLRMKLDRATQGQLMLGLHERETHPYLRIAMSRAKWAIDVGAGQGELSLLLAKQPQIETVIGIEPGWHHDLLVSNAALNKCFRLRPLQALVGTATNARALDTMPVDRLKRGFIKIDVDGGERDVLESGREIIAQRNCDWLIETHSYELERSCALLLAEAGYAVSIIDKAFWRILLPEQRPIPHNRWLWAEPA